MRPPVWVWTWGPPGPATEAQFWDNPVFDVIRLGVVVTGAVLACVIGRIIVEQSRRHDLMSRTQEFRFWALGLAVLSISATEAWVVGTTATPRLFVNVAVMVTACIGVAGKRRHQRREPLAGDLSTTQGDKE